MERLLEGILTRPQGYSAGRLYMGKAEEITLHVSRYQARNNGAERGRNWWEERILKRERIRLRSGHEQEIIYSKSIRNSNAVARIISLLES